MARRKSLGPQLCSCPLQAARACSRASAAQELGPFFLALTFLRLRSVGASLLSTGAARGVSPCGFPAIPTIPGSPVKTIPAASRACWMAAKRFL